MTRSSGSRFPLRRARRSFWILVGVAVLMAGSLSTGLAAEPSPLTGLRVAASGVILIVSVALAARVMKALRGAAGATGRVPTSGVAGRGG